jgi:hypothetical protein
MRLALTVAIGTITNALFGVLPVATDRADKSVWFILPHDLICAPATLGMRQWQCAHITSLLLRRD